MIGVLLTSNSTDGVRGLLELKEANSHTIVQDRENSVAWAALSKAINYGAARETLVLPAIADRIVTLDAIYSGDDD